jgi:D-glycero-beta-D-manno-heptose 1-phosphate adenylyltransferase
VCWQVSQISILNNIALKANAAQPIDDSVFFCKQVAWYYSLVLKYPGLFQILIAFITFAEKFDNRMNHFEHIKSKICDLTDLNDKKAVCNFKNLKVVFTNGCFDIIHRGHVEYLAKAASLGDILIIGLNTDASVRKLKGPGRPINDEMARALVLAAMSFVDHVILFDEDTPYNLIKAVQPDVLVKGSDYKPENIVGYDIVKNKGGEIVTIDFVAGYSTTSTIEKMESK